MALRAMELPLALGCLGLTVLTTVWKTTGLGFFPSLEMVFAKGKNAQYPVRKVNVQRWNLIYLCMYGILGTIAQLNGLLISTDSSNRKSVVNEITKRRASVFGLFHVIIGCHHILFAMGLTGRLNLRKYKIPQWIQVIGGIPMLWTLLHGFRLSIVKLGDDFDKVVRHKTVCDAVSLLTFTELAVFVPANKLGYKSFKLERNTWMVTLVAPVVVLCIDLLGL